MNAWQHLPNAHHIDWVIASVKVNPEKWSRAENAGLNADCDSSSSAAWFAALNAINNADRNAAKDAARWAVGAPSWDVILALIAYDDCDQYLSMSYEQLLTYAILSERPQAVLLLPLKWIQENACLATLT